MPSTRNPIDVSSADSETGGVADDSVTRRGTLSTTHGSTNVLQAPNGDASERNEQEVSDTHPSSSSDEFTGAATTNGDSEIRKDHILSEEARKLDSFTPYIRPPEYSTNDLPSTIPKVFDPVVVVGFPHLLGFLNAPIRIWRYVNKRKVADGTGAAVAAFVLSQDRQIRPFYKSLASPAEDITEARTSTGLSGYAGNELDDFQDGGEWHELAKAEEHEWHKSARKANPEGDEDKERPWQEPMVIDWRLGHRMRTVDTDRFSRLTRQTMIKSDTSHGAADQIGGLVASSAGSILSGSSGGSPVSSSTSQPKSMDWRGSADHKTVTGWTDWFSSLISSKKSGNRIEPWQQGMLREADED